MDRIYLLYGAQGSGSLAVEAALTLIGAPWRLIEAPTFDPDQAAEGDQVLTVNPMRQVPTLVLPGGEILTESAAILIWLAETHPEARLAPAPGAVGRAAFLRWMSFVSAAIYSLYWVKDEPERLAPSPSAQPDLVERTKARIAECWGMMAQQIEPHDYLLGDQLSMLDLYVAVVSQFQPGRQRFAEVAPNMAAVVRRVDDDPRLAELWRTRA